MSKNQVYITKKNLKKKIKLNINSRNKMPITIHHFKSLASGKTLYFGAIISDDVNTVCCCGSTCQRHNSLIRDVMVGRGLFWGLLCLQTTISNITLFIFLSDFSQKQHCIQARLLWLLLQYSFSPPIWLVVLDTIVQKNLPRLIQTLVLPV